MISSGSKPGTTTGDGETEPPSPSPRPSPRRRGKRRVMLRVAFIATLAGLAAVASVVVGVISGDREQLDRATARSIAAVAGALGQTISETLGEAALLSEGHAWRGLRMFDPALGAWIAIEPEFESGTGVGEALGDQLGGRVVLLIHGLDEPGGIWDQLAPALSGEGHTVVRFDYANDQAIVRSADELLAGLPLLEACGVTRLDLVCHSMGGLVAREAITRDAFAASGLRVERLITLGTPHAGSPWARLRAFAEIREQLQRWAESDDLDPKRLLGFVSDGVGEAGVDLLPGSDFLRQLDGRELPEGVRVTCVVGRSDGGEGAHGSGPIVLGGAFEALMGADEARVIREELDRLGDELGDGVVPVSSAVMAGVSDVVVIRANHRGMIRTIELEEAIRSMSSLPRRADPPAIQIVLERLRRD